MKEIIGYKPKECNCAHCGELFYIGLDSRGRQKKPQRFCSRKCSYNAWQKDYYLNNPKAKEKRNESKRIKYSLNPKSKQTGNQPGRKKTYTAVCINCGVPFTSNSLRPPKYCSGKCNSSTQRKTKRDSYISNYKKAHKKARNFETNAYINFLLRREGVQNPSKELKQQKILTIKLKRLINEKQRQINKSRNP